MKFNQTPHPVIEDHYHIQELINGQEKRSADRTKYQEIEKGRDQFEKEVAGYKPIELLDFWCENCRVDFIARAHIQIDSWGKLAYYKIKHRCGAWTLRRVTERLDDVYYFRSRKVAYDRGMAAAEMLQPFETGFNMLYGKK